MKRPPHPFIETLEARIAPATIINPYTVTFQDTDGDSAVIHISAPLFKNPTAAGKILLFTTNDGSTEHFTGNNVGESLSEINLLGVHAAQDMNISVKVIPQVGVGNNQVNVGDIAAANFSVTDQVKQQIHLGKIYIEGDLGQIFAGDDLPTPVPSDLHLNFRLAPAIESLHVLSMTQALPSDVLGPIKSLYVAGDFNAGLDVIGDRYGSIGNLYIGGSLAGDSSGDGGTGVIQFAGHIGSATIGNITGSDADYTGALAGNSLLPSWIGTLHVLGSITGGPGGTTGFISEGNCGFVFVNSGIRKLFVGGSIIGGTADYSGEILTNGMLRSATIQGGIIGGNSSSTDLTETGYIQAANIGTMTVDGTLTAGTAGSGVLTSSGAIFSMGSIGSITIGSIAGNTTSPAIIAAVGHESHTTTSNSDVAIGSVTIIGNATYADILAGYNISTQNGTQPLSTGANADAQIGTITISGDMMATNIIAGVAPGPDGFGTAGSTALGGPGVFNRSAIFSKISNLIIGGAVEATGSGSETYGIAAQYIASATVGGQKLSLVPGPDNDTFALGNEHTVGGSGGDVVLYEV